MASRPDVTDSRRKEADSTDDRQYELAAELIELQRERHELARRYLEIDYDLSSKEIEIEDEQNKRSYRTSAANCRRFCGRTVPTGVHGLLRE